MGNDDWSVIAKDSILGFKKLLFTPAGKVGVKLCKKDASHYYQEVSS